MTKVMMSYGEATRLAQQKLDEEKVRNKRQNSSTVEEQYQAFVWYLYDRLSVRQIAQRLDRRDKTVSHWLKMMGVTLRGGKK